MDDVGKIKNLKLVIGIALVGLVGYYALPILASMALNMVTIAMCGIFFMALWFFLPALSEAFAQLSYRLWEMAIRVDPIAKLKRELRDHSDQIANMETRISESDAQVTQLKNLLKGYRGTLSAEEIAEWEAQIQMLNDAVKEMISLHSQTLREHAEFERIVQKEEANYAMGKALKSVLGTLTFNDKSGKEAEGARIAINEVQKQLAESQSKLKLVLNRKMSISLPNKGAGNVIDITPQISATQRV